MNASLERPAPAPSRQRRGRRLFVVLALAAGGVLLWQLGHLGGGQVPAFAAWVEGLGVWGPVAFVAGYALATVAFVPGVLLTLVAGVLFGLVRGTLYVLAGATLGASGSFLLARYGARRLVERRLAAHPRFAAIDRAIGRQGWRIVFLLRLSPVFPYNLLNYALGLTRVRFRDYLLACLGMIPGTFLYVYYGKLLGTVAAVASGAQARRGAEYWALLGVGVMATVAATALITRKASQALREATAAAPAGAGDGAEPSRG